MTLITRSRRSINPVVPADSRGIAALSRFIETESATHAKPRLVSPANEAIELPDEVYEVLVQVAEQMRAGNAISVVPYAMTLSTQEAAEMLGISRPTLIRLLERDELPYSRPNRHRRLKLSDVLEYRERTHRATAERLDALTNEASSAALYEMSSTDYTDALRIARRHGSAR